MPPPQPTPQPPFRLDKALADRRALAQAFNELLAAQHTSANPVALAAMVSRAARPRQVLKLLLERMAEYNLAMVQAVIMVLNAASEATALFLLDALREVAYDARRPDTLRLSVVTVLCQREGQSVPDDFIATLYDPPAVALQSLRASLVEVNRTPGGLLEYLSSLSASEAEVQSTLVLMMRQLDDPLVVAPLRALAQDDRATLADAALEALASLHQPSAVIALLSLPPTLPPDRHAVTERTIRKLQMTVAPGQSPPALAAQPDPTSRAFLSLLDGRGSQMLWFALSLAAGSGEYELVSVLLNEKLGIKDAVGGITVPAASLPTPARIGALHRTVVSELSDSAMRRDLSARLREMVAQGEMTEVPAELISVLMEGNEDEGEEPPYLEVSFDYARRLLLAAQAETWSRGDSLPLAYRLFNAPLWRSQPPGPGAALGPELPLPTRLRSQPEIATTARELLASPFFVGWFLETPLLYDEVERMMRMMPRNGRVGPRKQAQIEQAMDEIRDMLVATHYRPEQLEALQTRLTRMAEWLTIAGERQLAARTLGLARTLSIEPPATNPFIILLVQRGIEVAAEALAGGFDLRDDPARFGHVGLTLLGQIML